MAEVAEDLTTTGFPVAFSPDGQNFTLSIPITKIDHEKRLIEGVATSETEDTQGDVVDYEASKLAFQSWPGNLREMHQPKAVGKRVSQEFDEANRLVRVRAYISRGAQDTWEKIVDGTLQAFSIGGKALDTVREVVKTADGEDHPRRRVTKYALSELSVADSGSNPDTAFALIKSDGLGGFVQTEVVEEEPIQVVMNKGSEILVVDPQAEADILKFLSQSGFEKIGQLAKVDADEENEPPLLQAWLIKLSCPSCGEVAWAPKLDSGGGRMVCTKCDTIYEVGYKVEDGSLQKTAEEQLSSGAGKSTLKEVKDITSDWHMVYDCPSCDYTSEPTTIPVGKQAPEKKCPECKTLLSVQGVAVPKEKEGQQTGTIATSPEELQTQMRGVVGGKDDLLKQGELKIVRLNLVAQGQVSGRLLKMYKQEGGRWITTEGGRRVRITPPKGRAPGGEEIPPEPPIEGEEERPYAEASEVPLPEGFLEAIDVTLKGLQSAVDWAEERGARIPTGRGGHSEEGLRAMTFQDALRNLQEARDIIEGKSTEQKPPETPEESRARRGLPIPEFRSEAAI